MMRISVVIVPVSFLFLGIVGCDRGDHVDAEKPDPDLPRVLLITLDTTRADRLGCYGHASAETPRLDALAASGVRFNQAFCQVPLTLPSHASMLTGRYPAATGIRTNGAGALPDNLPTLGSFAKARGYRTGAFVSTFVLHNFFGLNAGFETYDDDLGSDGSQRSLAKHEERSGEKVCDAALAWLDEDPKAPFLAWVHFFDPHHPYEPPAPYSGRLAYAYDGEIAFMDAQIGRLLDGLDRHGLRERTLIVVAGDHGESLGEHGEAQHGLFLYGATLRVPLIMSFSGKLPASRVIDGSVQLVDVLPTILDVLGWDVDATMDGRSVLTAWESGNWGFEPCYGESDYPRLSFGWSSLRSLTTERWKYVAAPRPELYDRVADPGELANVISSQPKVASRLQTTLSQMEAGMASGQARAVTLGATARSRLESLGYVAGSQSVSASQNGVPGRDPKDMVDVLHGLMQAKVLTHSGNFAGAVRLLEPLAVKSPESDSLFRTLGAAYLSLGRLVEAEAAYKKSLRGFPSDPERLCGLADTFFYRRMFDRAVPLYELALESDPDFAQVHSRLGTIHVQRRRINLAEKHVGRYLALRPNSANAL